MHKCDNLTVQCHPWIHAGCPITCIEDIRIVSTVNNYTKYREIANIVLILL